MYSLTVIFVFASFFFECQSRWKLTKRFILDAYEMRLTIILRNLKNITEGRGERVDGQRERERDRL